MNEHEVDERKVSPPSWRIAATSQRAASGLSGEPSESATPALPGRRLECFAYTSIQANNHPQVMGLRNVHPAGLILKVGPESGPESL